MAGNHIAEVYHGSVASEVFLHKQGRGGSVGILLFGWPRTAVGGEHLRFRSAESVDALLDVAYHEPSAATLRQGGEDAILQVVGILVFVNEDIVEGFAGLDGRFRGVTVPVGEQAGGQLLQIGEIHDTPLPLAGAKGIEIDGEHPGDVMGHLGGAGAGHRRFLRRKGKGFFQPPVDLFFEFGSLVLEIQALSGLVVFFYAFAQRVWFISLEGVSYGPIGSLLRRGKQCFC